MTPPQKPQTLFMAFVLQASATLTGGHVDERKHCLGNEGGGQFGCSPPAAFRVGHTFENTTYIRPTVPSAQLMFFDLRLKTNHKYSSFGAVKHKSSNQR